MIRISKRKRGCVKTTVVRLGSIIFCCGLMCFFQPAICSEAALGVETVHETETKQSEEMTHETPEDQAGIEITQLSQIMVADTAVSMKAKPDFDAETLMIYEKDALVFVIGETADGWYFVTYQDKEGYVQKDLLSVQEIDVEGLDAEMAANEEEGKLVVEAVEKYRVESRRSKIWGSIIIVLVVSIFALGIFSTMKTKKSGVGAGAEKRKKHIKIEDWN